jgi:hypothetical protein
MRPWIQPRMNYVHTQLDARPPCTDAPLQSSIARDEKNSTHKRGESLMHSWL